MGALTLNAFGPLIDEELADLALFNGFDFHRRLVGFDLGDHIAGIDLIAF
jgi:hypothetical protein